VANYLSPDWFERIGAAAGEEAAPLRHATLVLQHVVTGGPDGEVWYHVRLSPGAVEIVRGPALHPHVTFAEDYATAAAIARGTLSAPAALLAGRIRLGGDLSALLAHQDVLAAEDPIPAAIRAETTY
jgi:hypothetical protein